MSNPPLPDPLPAGTPSWLGATSLSLGLISLALSWLPPYSIVLGAAGMLCGVVAMLRPSGRRGNGRWLAVGGAALSLAAVAMCAFLMPGWWHHPWPIGGP